MIKDLFGIYLCNRGIAVLDPRKAMPEEKAKRYLYEAVGLQPWLGSDADPGADREDADRPAGTGASRRTTCSSRPRG